MKNAANVVFAASFESGGKGTRTPDLIHAMDALYQN